MKTFSEEDVTLQRQILGLKKQDNEEDNRQTEVVYERASPELIEARRFIFEYAKER